MTPYWEPEDFRFVLGAKIEYDPDKEEYNRKTHKYSFAGGLYLIEHLLLPIHIQPHIIRDASTAKERRHEHMTVDNDGKVVFFVTTMRDNHTIRMVSLRRASEEERKVFKAETGFNEVS